MRMPPAHLIISLDAIQWRAFADRTCPSVALGLHMLIESSFLREGYCAMRAQICRIFGHRVRATARRVGGCLASPRHIYWHSLVRFDHPSSRLLRIF